MLAVPLSTYRYVDLYENGRYSWSYEYISKLMLVKVNQSDGTLSMHGEVNHSSMYDNGGERYWWDSNDIRRSIFMGDFVYAISSAGITATNLTTLEETARIVLPQDQTLDDVRYDDVAVAEDTEGEERDRSSSSDEEAVSYTHLTLPTILRV